MINKQVILNALHKELEKIQWCLDVDKSYKAKLWDLCLRESTAEMIANYELYKVYRNRVTHLKSKKKRIEDTIRQVKKL